MIRHFLLFLAKEHKNTKGQAKRNESITGCDNRWKRGRIFSTCPYRNVSISLPAIPLLFSIPFHIVENRKDNKKKEERREKSGQQERCPIERKHICVNPSVYIAKSLWIAGVDHGGGREQCDLSRFS